MAGTEESLSARQIDTDNSVLVREIELSAEELIHRFLLHVLPDRFVRIRSYGLLATPTRGRDLPLSRKLLGVGTPQAVSTRQQRESWNELLERLTGVDPTLCRECRQGHLQRRRQLAAERSASRSPP